ncbi:retron Ec67 family RNA-directed DNA polymerase/endonuclease [Lactococcus lactis]|uniref:retron Ec67 family RNA-directed DNA polymerase/endonuclease n=1 Tax=Lactococcus lactis TaxID=1358 RepID=UPI0018A92C62|nr:retron Ec67 family RNA-directed DNA polymerase/endonuclease [Lactococcus lactis]
MNYNDARNSIADKINVPPKLLSYIFLTGIDKFYTEIEIPKKNGGVRKISIPQNQLKSVHQEVLKFLQKIYKNSDLATVFSHGFEKNKSIITNAQVHKNKRIVLNMDLEDFFYSFHFGRIRGFFKNNKFFKMTHEEATVLSNLICYKGVLPQGAATSPIMTNMICHFMDLKLQHVAKKHKCSYTRYADDLTFSTNNKNTVENYKELIKDIKTQINKAGFKINDDKTRLQSKENSQRVTGLVVNKKVNVSHYYYKKTRAMAESLYKTGKFYINDQEGDIKQLEGRFSFIDQLNFANNIQGKKDGTGYHGFFTTGNDGKIAVNNREKSYQKFLFYKYFYANDKPTILTEGKTDIKYLKAALKKMYLLFPNLIKKKETGFEFKVNFLERSRRFDFFFGYVEGAEGMKKIFELYFRKPFYYYNEFQLKRTFPNQKPVFLIFDNELKNNKKPIRKFINFTNGNVELKVSKVESENFLHIDKNLYLITHQLMNDKDEMEIEDLFSTDVLSAKVDGKIFDRNDNADRSKTFGKAVFAEYITRNYRNIDFSNFIPMLHRISEIISNT